MTLTFGQLERGFHAISLNYLPCISKSIGKLGIIEFSSAFLMQLILERKRLMRLSDSFMFPIKFKMLLFRRSRARRADSAFCFLRIAGFKWCGAPTVDSGSRAGGVWRRFDISAVAQLGSACLQ